LARGDPSRHFWEPDDEPAAIAPDSLMLDSTKYNKVFLEPKPITKDDDTVSQKSTRKRKIARFLLTPSRMTSSSPKIKHSKSGSDLDVLSIGEKAGKIPMFKQLSLSINKSFNKSKYVVEKDKFFTRNPSVAKSLKIGVNEIPDELAEKIKE
jgi:hypothetical protein